MLLTNRHFGIWQFAPMWEATDKGGGGGADPPADDSDLDSIEGLGDKGKEAIKAERKARRDADAALKTLQGSVAGLQDSLKALQDEKTQRDADAAAAAERDRESRGEFEALAKTREQERDKAKDDLKALQERFDALHAVATATVKTDFDALPQEVRDVYSGAADDPVAMLAFIPKGKALAAKLTGGEENNSRNTDGAKPNPPVGDGNTDRRTESDKKAAELFAGTYW